MPRITHDGTNQNIYDTLVAGGTPAPKSVRELNVQPKSDNPGAGFVDVGDSNMDGTGLGVQTRIGNGDSGHWGGSTKNTISLRTKWIRGAMGDVSFISYDVA